MALNEPAATPDMASRTPVAEIPVARTPSGAAAVTNVPAEAWEPEEPFDSARRWRGAFQAISRSASTTREPERQVLDAAVLAAKALQTDLFGCSHRDRQGDLVLRIGKVTDAAAEPSSNEHMLPEEPSRSLARFASDGSEPVVVADLASETRFQDAVLVQQGVESALVCPMAPDSGLSGTIGVYCSQPRQFSDDDVALLESITRLVCTNIARQQAVESLAQQREFSTSLLETLDAAVMTLSPEGRIGWMNRACQEVTGFTRNELADRSIWNALLLPEEIGVVKDAFESLAAGETPIRFETGILTKHGDRRRIAWSFTQLRAADGAVESLIGTGIDITRQCELLDQFARAEQAANEARRSLRELEQRGREEEAASEEESPASTLPSGIAQNRRNEPRREYPFMQRVAPKFGLQTPGLDAFEQVRCHDISAHGFSYYSSRKPDCEEVVVALGNQPSLVYLIARIMHASPIQFEGENVFLVGCKYTSRARYK